MEVFIIKIKVKGYLKNLTENTKELIDTKGIKSNNIISYIIDNTKYKLTIENKKIFLLRESNEFIHTMTFEENTTYPSEYFLKESKYSLDFNIKTIKIIINKTKVNITYKILESENAYNYVLEVSDNL